MAGYSRFYIPSCRLSAGESRRRPTKRAPLRKLSPPFWRPPQFLVQCKHR